VAAGGGAYGSSLAKNANSAVLMMMLVAMGINYERNRLRTLCDLHTSHVNLVSIRIFEVALSASTETAKESICTTST
jgi:hypothetical protein